MIIILHRLHHHFHFLLNYFRFAMPQADSFSPGNGSRFKYEYLPSLLNVHSDSSSCQHRFHFDGSVIIWNDWHCHEVSFRFEQHRSLWTVTFITGASVAYSSAFKASRFGSGLARGMMAQRSMWTLCWDLCHTCHCSKLQLSKTVNLQGKWMLKTPTCSHHCLS